MTFDQHIIVATNTWWYPFVRIAIGRSWSCPLRIKLGSMHIFWTLCLNWKRKSHALNSHWSQLFECMSRLNDREIFQDCLCPRKSIAYRWARSQWLIRIEKLRLIMLFQVSQQPDQSLDCGLYALSSIELILKLDRIPTDEASFDLFVHNRLSV